MKTIILSLLTASLITSCAETSYETLHSYENEVFTGVVDGRILSLDTITGKSYIRDVYPNYRYFHKTYRGEIENEKCFGNDTLQIKD